MSDSEPDPDSRADPKGHSEGETAATAEAEPRLEPAPIPESGAMLGLILRFLGGSESAMAALAVHPWSLRVGLAFVLLAGVAREYDGEDLLGEPWHLLVPLVASLVSGTLLFLFLRFGAWRKGVAREDRPGYLGFLRLFWLTAPLALVYAIPFERFLDPPAAAHANMALLLIVATWRVWLMIRVTRVLFGASTFAATSLVLFYGGVLLFFALQFSPVPIISVMGGLRLSPAEKVVQWWMMQIFLLTFFGLPLMFLLSVAALSRGPVDGVPAWQPRVNLGELEPTAPRNLPSPKDAFGVAGVALLALLPLIPTAQAEQRARRRIERAFHSGDVAAALEDLREIGRDGLPPNWAPPKPRWVSGRRRSFSRPDLFRALKPDEDWLWERYAELWLRELGDPTPKDPNSPVWVAGRAAESDLVLSERERLEISTRLIKHVPDLDWRCARELQLYKLPEARREAKRILGEEYIGEPIESAKSEDARRKP